LNVFRSLFSPAALSSRSRGLQSVLARVPQRLNNNFREENEADEGSTGEKLHCMLRNIRFEFRWPPLGDK